MRRLVVWAIGLPLFFLALFQVLERLVVDHLPLNSNWGLATVFLLLATLAFAITTVRAFMRLQQKSEVLYEEAKEQSERVEALRTAALLLTGDLDLDVVLERVVRLSRELVNARFAKLEVFDREGGVEQEVHAGDEPPEEGGDEALWQPIRYQERTIGALHLYGPRPGGFTSRDRLTVEMMAQQAAIAITNAILLRQVHRLAAVEERQRISMDLHDGTLQSLYAVSLQLEATLGLLENRPKEAARRLDEAVERLGRISRDIRHYIFDLNVERTSLAESIDAMAEEFGLRRVEKDIDERAWTALSEEAQRAALAIAREALANAKRHAGVDAARVRLSLEGGAAVLTVSDRGSGFRLAEAGSPPGHTGLENMRTRARNVGARFLLESRVGAGTVVGCQFPLREEM
jgi:signal transduction histidine kinase